MKARNLSISILVAIIATIGALYAHQFFPKKRFLVESTIHGATFLYGVDIADGQSAASWLDQDQRKFRCVYPDGFPIHYYYCSFNQVYDYGGNRGVDLSGYDHINLVIEYDGTAPKMRFFTRNYNEAYSTPEDSNSTKYNAIYLATAELDGELGLGVDEFVVTEWWRMQYKIQRMNSFPDLSNVVNIGVDFSDSMTPGNHDVTIKKIEFVGDWITRENWYLLILSIWLAGVFLHTINHLLLLRKQKIHDQEVISSLSDDKNKLIQETNKFRKLSTIDMLTETYNRFGIDQIVTTLLASNAKVGEDVPCFSLMVLDIDHFKRINDRRGHDVGDVVLQKISTIIKNTIRKGDYVGRWGGEEFVIILPRTGPEFAMALAEKIRQVISYTVFDPENPLRATVSIGVGSHQEDEDFSYTFKRVDEALYAAKTAGRNCSVPAEPGVAP